MLIISVSKRPTSLVEAARLSASGDTLGKPELCKELARALRDIAKNFDELEREAYKLRSEVEKIQG